MRRAKKESREIARPRQRALERAYIAGYRRWPETRGEVKAARAAAVRLFAALGPSP